MTDVSSSLTYESVHKTVEALGTTIHYCDVVSGEPILMVSSYGPTPGTTAWLVYGKVFEALSSRYRCVAMDLPNVGLTGPVEHHEVVGSLGGEQRAGVHR